MTDNSNEIFPIVDEEGNIIGSDSRAVCHNGSKLLHPVVHLHIFDNNGRLFLQRRPEWKDIQPGKWDTAVGGHIDYGESVEMALRREALEELGLSCFNEIAIDRYIFESEREKELVNVFMTVTSQPLSPSEELDGGNYFTIDEILRMKGKGLLTPNFEKEFERFKFQFEFYLSQYIGSH